MRQRGAEAVQGRVLEQHSAGVVHRAARLAGLLSGEVLGWSDTPVAGVSSMAEGVIDRYVQRRASARAASRGRFTVTDSDSEAEAEPSVD